MHWVDTANTICLSSAMLIFPQIVSVTGLLMLYRKTAIK